ncbi:MAG: sigma-70 family RNA polymerase sigma factor [Planctomycetes bacterium]|nr:sigma-70 family RNA polymerase sigma factor [Planctomycetota bacterium]
MSDQQIHNLVRQAQSGDRSAFGELAVQFERTVFAIVLRKLHNRSEAREVTQDVFVQAMRKLSQLREPERFAGWLRQIATRMSINRAVRRPREMIRSPEALAMAKTDPDTPLDSLLRSERRNEVQRGLSRLQSPRLYVRQTAVRWFLSRWFWPDQFQSPQSPSKLSC